MGMTIDELITFCEEEEYNHRLNCKRYDDASGYTRSKDKNIRTACAIREDTYGDFYKQIAECDMCGVMDVMHTGDAPTVDGQSIFVHDTVSAIKGFQFHRTKHGFICDDCYKKLKIGSENV